MIPPPDCKTEVIDFPTIDPLPVVFKRFSNRDCAGRTQPLTGLCHEI
jgi:hypothetical protein